MHDVSGRNIQDQYGRVDQLEDRYLGMVEAPSSNLGTSTFDSLTRWFNFIGNGKVHN